RRVQKGLGGVVRAGEAGVIGGDHQAFGRLPSRGSTGGGGSEWFKGRKKRLAGAECEVRGELVGCAKNGHGVAALGRQVAGLTEQHILRRKIALGFRRLLEEPGS